MSDDGDGETATVPVICEECETTTRVALSEVADVVQRHNDQLHDGADQAQIDPDVVEHVTDLVAEDLGLLDDAE